MGWTMDAVAKEAKKVLIFSYTPATLVSASWLCVWHLQSIDWQLKHNTCIRWPSEAKVQQLRTTVVVVVGVEKQRGPLMLEVVKVAQRIVAKQVVVLIFRSMFQALMAPRFLLLFLFALLHVPCTRNVFRAGCLNGVMYGWMDCATWSLVSR